MKRSRTYSLAMGVCLLSGALVAAPVAATASAATPTAADAAPARPRVTRCPELTATLDTRAVKEAVVPSAATREALTKLLASSGRGARATWDERFGTLRSLRSSSPLTGPQEGAAADIARRWVADNAAAFGLSSAAVKGLTVARDHTLPQTGTHVVSLVQTRRRRGRVPRWPPGTSPSPRTAACCRMPATRRRTPTSPAAGCSARQERCSRLRAHSRRESPTPRRPTARRRATPPSRRARSAVRRMPRR